MNDLDILVEAYSNKPTRKRKELRLGPIMRRLLPTARSLREYSPAVALAYLQAAVYYTKTGHLPPATDVLKYCVYCGMLFCTDHANARFCCEKHQQAWNYKQRKLAVLSP